MCSTSSAHEQSSTGRCCVQGSQGRWSPLSCRHQVAHKTDRTISTPRLSRQFRESHPPTQHADGGLVSRRYHPQSAAAPTPTLPAQRSRAQNQTPPSTASPSQPPSITLIVYNYNLIIYNIIVLCYYIPDASVHCKSVPASCAACSSPTHRRASGASLLPCHMRVPATNLALVTCHTAPS